MFLKCHRHRHLRRAPPPPVPHFPSGKGRLMGSSPEGLWHLPLGPQFCCFFFFHDTNLPFSVPSRSRGRGEGPGSGWSQLRPGTPNLIVNVQRGSQGAPGFLMGEVGGGAGAQRGPRQRRQRPLLSGGGRSCTGHHLLLDTQSGHGSEV